MTVITRNLGSANRSVDGYQISGSSLASRFAGQSSGNIAIIFAFTFTLIAAMVGGAVDYGRAVSARSKMQNAMDSAVLAAARQWQVSGSEDIAAAIQLGEEVFNSQKPIASIIPHFTVNPQASTVVGTATTTIENPFLSFLGVADFVVSIESTALLKVGGNSGFSVEMSMMLDVTGSMGYGDNKLGNMQDAAKDLIDIVVWDDQSEYTSRVAIVPFSENVNIGSTYFSQVTGQSGTNNSKTCVKERSNGNRYNDAAPGSGNYFDARYSNSCKPKNARLMPLTNDKNALKARIDDFQADGYTAGHLGTAWAWYTLSPNWNDVVWTGTNKPAPYPAGHDAPTQKARNDAYAAAKLKKIAVLMTDGEYNKKYSGSGSATQARAQCDAMKAKGIEIYTVGFELPNQAARDIMEYCATDEEHFYDATDGEKLRMAFRDIALKVATLRLSK